MVKMRIELLDRAVDATVIDKLDCAGKEYRLIRVAHLTLGDYYLIVMKPKDQKDKRAWRAVGRSASLSCLRQSFEYRREHCTNK